MGESRNMDAAMRIREINSARESIGEDAYLGTDSGIVEAFEYDLCQELVLNDPEYSAKLFERQEAERIAREEREEAERIAREEQEEALRIAREEQLEAERIALEERQEAARIAYQKNQQEYTDSILSVFEEYPPSFSFVRSTFTELLSPGGYRSSTRFKVKFRCINAGGFLILITVEFEGNLGTLTTEDTAYSCLDGTDIVLEEAEMQDLYANNPSDFIQRIEKITIEWNGRIIENRYDDTFSTAVEKRDMTAKVDSRNFGGVDPDLSRLPHTWVIYEKE